jgi:hypothetical protein
MKCGIAAIDRLMADASAPAVDAADRPAVAAVQSLLTGHGFRGLPTPLDRSSGILGPLTRTAVSAFRSARHFVVSDVIDAPTVRALVTTPATSAVLSRAYVTLVLGVDFSGILPLAAVTMQLEGAGRFGAANWNTDRCGLSFGLIQWAQRPGRLHELLRDLHGANPQRFGQIFAAGDSPLAEGLLTHTAKASGGVDRMTGVTTDPRFDLVAEPWLSRFIAAGREPVFQRQQIVTATDAFRRSLQSIRPTVPVVASERGLAAMLDVANQFGDAGARAIAAEVMKPGMTETEFLLAMENETVARVGRKYGAASLEVHSTANRRALVRTTSLLTDGPSILVVNI